MFHEKSNIHDLFYFKLQSIIINQVLNNKSTI